MIVSILFGCAAPAGPATPLAQVTQDDHTSITVTGDWEDVHAAAVVSVGAIEAAIESARIDETSARFDLLTIDGEPATLQVTRQPESHDLTVTASVGLFPDRRRELRLLAAFEKRITQLHAVPYAPL